MNELSFEACRVYMIVNAVSVVLIIYYLFTRLDLHLNGDKDTLYFPFWSELILFIGIALFIVSIISI